MSSLEDNSAPTSNELMHSTVATQSQRALNYQVVVQSADEVQDVRNAPAVTMGAYLLESGQIDLLRRISVYSDRGETREQMRLLYLNAVAMKVWGEMGKAPKIIGAQFRPPHTALLIYGVPFSE